MQGFVRPELTKIASPLSISLIVVEMPAEKIKHGYTAMPITVTFEGRYQGFTALVAVIEGIQPAPKIDYLRIYRRKRTDEVRLTLTLSMMTRRGAGKNIVMPPIETVKLTTTPFVSVQKADKAKLDKTETPSQDSETPLPKLIAILWDEDKPIAILKHLGKRHTVGEGEQIAGATIIAIEPQQITLQRDGKQYQLKVWKQKGIQLK